MKQLLFVFLILMAIINVAIGWTTLSVGQSIQLDYVFGGWLFIADGIFLSIIFVLQAKKGGSE